MFNHIPITFTCEGKEYTGNLNQVTGSGGTAVFNLSIDSDYCGRLRIGQDDWIFDPTPKTKAFAEMADYFGSYVLLWYC